MSAVTKTQNCSNLKLKKLKKTSINVLASFSLACAGLFGSTSISHADDPFALTDTCSVWVEVQESGAQSSDDLVRSLTCQFYVTGFLDGYATNDEYSYSTSKPRDFQICFPDTVTVGELINSFVRYTRTKDLSGDADQHTILYMSMVAKYPCVS